MYTDPTTRNKAKNELTSTDIAISGSRALTMANHQGKGWFALTLGKVIDFKVSIPNYIFNAIRFVHNEFSKELIFKILEHRYNSIIEHVTFGREKIEEQSTEGNLVLKETCEKYLAPYESGLKRFTPKWEKFNLVDDDINELKLEMINAFPNENTGVLTRI